MGRKIKIVKNDLRKNFIIQNFIEYFRMFPDRTYDLFILWFNKHKDKLNPHLPKLEIKELTLIRRELQRRGIMISVKGNDSSGDFKSDKAFNLENIREYYDVDL